MAITDLPFNLDTICVCMMLWLLVAKIVNKYRWGRDNRAVVSEFTTNTNKISSDMQLTSRCLNQDLRLNHS
jgi:hypothetical protein